MEYNQEMKTNEEAKTSLSISNQETDQVELLNKIHRLYFVEALGKLKTIVMSLKSKPAFYLLSCGDEPKDIKKGVKTLKQDLESLWGEQQIVCPVLSLKPGDAIAHYVSQMEQCDIIVVFCTPRLKQAYEALQSVKLQYIELSLLFSQLKAQKSKIIPCYIGNSDNILFFLSDIQPASLSKEKDYQLFIFHLLEQAVREPNLKESIKLERTKWEQTYKAAKKLSFEKRKALLTELERKEAADQEVMKEATYQQLANLLGKQTSQSSSNLFSSLALTTDNLMQKENPLEKLCDAAIWGDVILARKYLQNGVDINDKFLELTPLHYAVVRNKLNMVEFLLDNKADINAYRKADGCKVLHLLVVNGKENENFADMIEFLIKKGADINATTIGDTGCTALIFAAQYKRNDILKILIHHNADINLASTKQGLTALHVAAIVGNDEAANILINRDADPSLKTKETYETALGLAIRCNNTNIQKLLTKVKHQPFSDVNEGKTVLNTAVENELKSIKIAENLFEFGTAYACVVLFYEGNLIESARSNYKYLKDCADELGIECENYDKVKEVRSYLDIMHKKVTDKFSKEGFQFFDLGAHFTICGMLRLSQTQPRIVQQYVLDLKIRMLDFDVPEEIIKKLLDILSNAASKTELLLKLKEIKAHIISSYYGTFILTKDITLEP